MLRTAVWWACGAAAGARTDVRERRRASSRRFWDRGLDGMTRFAVVLRKLRKERGLKQSDVARLVGVSESAIGMYEQGRRMPVFPIVEKTAHVFDVPVESLYDPAELRESAYVTRMDITATPKVVTLETEKPEEPKEEKPKAENAAAVTVEAKPARKRGRPPGSGKGGARKSGSDDSAAPVRRSEPVDEARSRLFDREFTTKFSEIGRGGRTVVRAVLEAEHRRQCEDSKKSAMRMEYRPINLMELPVSAGTGIALLPEDRPVPIYVPLDSKSRTADFVIEVQGDSMEPEYHDKDLILVRQTTAIQPGEVGIFGMNGEGYFKKLEEGRLVSLNPKYSPIVFQEGDDVIFFGRVLGTAKRIYPED